MTSWVTPDFFIFKGDQTYLSLETKAEQPDPDDLKGLKRIFRAFRYRNYRLFFAGQSVSWIGTWIQRIAMSWLVYRLTNSAFLLGVVGFSSQIPTFLFVSFAGVLVDRWSRHRILVVTQSLTMMYAMSLAILVLTHRIAIWHIIGLGMFVGIVNAFDAPARQSFVVEMVEKKEDLGNAIALNSSMVNGARLIGPSVAGMLISAVGEGICFLINSLSYLAVIAALLAMRLSPAGTEDQKTHVLGELKEGFSYTFGFPPIRSVLLLLSLVSLMGMPYVVLMPIFAKNILHGGPHTLGFLMGGVGAGALIGVVFLAARRSARGLEKTIPMATTIFGVGLIAFSLSRNFLLSLLLITMAGFGMMVQTASCNTVLQTIVDDDKRGRVMSFYAMSFMGTAPFGSLLAGSLASMMNAPSTLLIGGTSCIIGAVIFASRLPSQRELFRALG